VSSSDQTEHLDRQSRRLDDDSSEECKHYAVTDDFGSGLKYKKCGLKTPIHLTLCGHVDWLTS